MKTIAEIGKDRLSNVLVNDTPQNKYLISNIIKSEISTLLSSYAELDDEIEVKMETNGGRIKFEIKASACRIKEFGQVVD